MPKAIPTDSVFSIALERPASVRRHLPTLSDGWLVERYFVGPENEKLRYLFDDKTVQNLGTVSPVVICGEKSLGKTALAITLAVRWSRLIQLRPICFTTGDAFVADYAAAVEIDDIDSFRARHRECKMLVIDDLEPLLRKSAAQEELSNTLDFLGSLERPIIVTMTQLPATAKGFKPTLASRLSVGFSIPLNRPSKHTRNALIDSLISKIDKTLPSQQLHSIAENLSGNAVTNPTGTSTALGPTEIRDLVTMAHQNKLATGRLDSNIVTQLMRQHLKGDQPNLLQIAKTVARRMRVKLLDMRGSSREANIVRARGLAIYLARKLTPLSLQLIGEFFDGRDHSTVLHAWRKTMALLESDTELANLCREVESDLLS